MAEDKDLGGAKPQGEGREVRTEHDILRGERTVPAEPATGAARKTGSVQVGGETPYPPRMKFGPVISREDWATYNRLHPIFSGDAKDDERPGEGTLDRFSRHSKEADTYNYVNYRVQEAIDINEGRDLAIEFGIDPSKADDDPVFRRDLKIAAGLLKELGLDGKTVYGDDVQRSALELLIASEVRMSGSAASVERVEAEIERVQRELQEKLAAERAKLEKEGEYNNTLREALNKAVGKREAKLAVDGSPDT